jgi:hypothetical protein
LNPVSTDEGDEVVLIDSAGVRVRCSIISTASTTVATVRTDKEVTTGLQAIATASWEFARDSVSGLGHLESETVSILGDGSVFPQGAVSSGAVALERPASVVHVGLQYNSDMETLPISTQTDEALGQGRQKNINRVWLKVNESSGIFVGQSVDNLKEAKTRTDELYGSPPSLKSEDVEVVLPPSWNDDGNIFARQSDPLPLMITGLVIETSLGG